MNKYEKLTKDLKESYRYARKFNICKSEGTENMDNTFLILKGWREKNVLDSIKNAGLYCTHKTKWIGMGYLINTGGIASNRTLIRNKFAEELEKRGYEVLHFDMVD